MPELNAFGRGFNSRRLHQSQQPFLPLRQGVTLLIAGPCRPIPPLFPMQSGERLGEMILARLAADLIGIHIQGDDRLSSLSSRW